MIFHFDIQAGDSLTMSGGGFTRNYTIPDLAVTNIDISTETLSGTAPTGEIKIEAQTELIGSIPLYSLTNPVFGHTYSQPLISIQARTGGCDSTMMPVIPLQYTGEYETHTSGLSLMMTTLRDVIGIQVQLFLSRLMTPIRQNWRIILPLVLQILMGLSIFTCMGLICNQGISLR